MASMQHENRVVSETTVHKTVSIPDRIEYSHSKKIFLNILEAKYLVEKGKEVLEERVTLSDGTIRHNFFVWVSFSCIEDDLPTRKGE